ncbi:MAG: tetratricopeptide repeat protein [Nevskia sp.]|nr:tetratricopeptide repeat protein [Nevskia sp.]
MRRATRVVAGKVMVRTRCGGRTRPAWWSVAALSCCAALLSPRLLAGEGGAAFVPWTDSHSPNTAPPGDAGAESAPMGSDPAEMVQHLKDRLARQPDDYDGWMMLGRSLEVMNDPEGSKAAYARAAQLKPRAGSQTPGSSAESMPMDPAVMVQHLKDRLARQPDDYDGWMMLGRSLQVMNDPEGSKAAYERAAKLRSGSVSAAAPPAPAMGPDGMVQRLKDRLAKQPEDFDGWMMLGRSLRVLNDTAGSLAAYEHALKLKPDDMAARCNYLRALLLDTESKKRTTLPQAAVDSLKSLGSQYPDAPEIRYLTGLAARVKGDRSTAREIWTKLEASLAPGSDAYAMVEGDLKSLDGG